MEIKRYYIADLSFALSKFNICVCRPFECDNKLYADIWHPVSHSYEGRTIINGFSSTICAGYYFTLREAFSAVTGYKSPLPETSFTGYKILRHKKYRDVYLLGILEIPENARKVAPLFSNKMRVERALVKDILLLIPYGRSYHTTVYDEDFALSYFLCGGQKLQYVKGHTVKADTLDEDITKVATHGIHFYLTRKEAISSLKRINYA